MILSSPVLKHRSGNARQLWTEEPFSGTAFAWLGQAGFAFRAGPKRILLDPYLSDYLEKKYRGTDKPHPRLMPAPLEVESLGKIDFVICTHRHSDHMDPETIGKIARAFPECRFIVPQAELEHALSLGVAAERLTGIEAGETIALAPDLILTGIAAAHETLEVNERGEHRFLGYLLRFAGTTIYHSGDTIPYPGLIEGLSAEKIDAALLPVNGRGKGVPGNFTFGEAVDLCQKARIPWLVPHHFGMFAFNTVDPSVIADQAASITYPHITVPDVKTEWHADELVITVARTAQP